ncbi:hypothetical protein [Lampropedia aestuarii]|uniref:hypothetical protein n=1 Tax=Lampropedia aestuarii TaxID=2562762 RepID=UPI002468947D|nr:hypothetical protein [Lampropedia aestuarii]MDH5858647.1 hypothetical protein [Lampropedia aestuarii]
MDEKVAHVEVWKKIIDVQQHFNDLELRIRNFALIVTGAFLGLGGYAIKDGGFTNLWGNQISSAALIIGTSLLPLCAFYLMDRLWYHRLLDGAVKAGIAAENKLIELGINVGLGSQISIASPFKLWIFGNNVHSRHKMDGFYGLLAIAIIALAVTLACAIKPPKAIHEVTGNDRFSNVVAQSQGIDDKAAKAICEAHLKELLGMVDAAPGSLVIDSKTGTQAVLVSGRWRLVPKC